MILAVFQTYINQIDTYYQSLALALAQREVYADRSGFRRGVISKDEDRYSLRVAYCRSPGAGDRNVRHFGGRAGYEVLRVWKSVAGMESSRTSCHRESATVSKFLRA